MHIMFNLMDCTWKWSGDERPKANIAEAFGQK